VPLPLALALGSLLVLAGVALLAVAVLGARSRLRRNRFAGVRTTATLASDEAFVLANRVGAAPIGAAGAVALAGGVVLLAGGPGPVLWTVAVICLLGTLVLTGVGGVLGDRAAARLTPPPAEAGCAGACAGCDLVAGCRPAASQGPPPGSAAERAAG
jgi:SdpI/YhfL family protein